MKGNCDQTKLKRSLRRRRGKLFFFMVKHNFHISVDLFEENWRPFRQPQIQPTNFHDQKKSTNGKQKSIE